VPIENSHTLKIMFFTYSMPHLLHAPTYSTAPHLKNSHTLKIMFLKKNATAPHIKILPPVKIIIFTPQLKYYFSWPSPHKNSTPR